MRDSHVPTAGIHYRVAIDELLPRTDGVYRITEAVVRD